MTLKTIADLLQAYVWGNRFLLAEQKIELTHSMVGDGIQVRATSYPGVLTRGPDSVSELWTLKQLYADSRVRDPDKGLKVLVVEIIGSLIARILAGRDAVSPEGSVDAVQGEQGQGGLQGDDPQPSPGDEQEAADGA